MRTSPEALDLAAVDAIGRALPAAIPALKVDVQAKPPSRPRPRSGIVRVDLDTVRATFHVHGVTLLDEARVSSLVRREVPDNASAHHLVVADKIVGDARRALDAAGWSWLDRRGRLHLRAPGLAVDADVEPLPRRPPRGRATSRVLASSGAQEVAVALLLADGELPGVRELARSIGTAPSTVSRALTALRDLGLVRATGAAVHPDLFWALAEHWEPEWQPLVADIRPDDPRLAALGADLADLDTVGWAIGDTRAALAWRAPVVASTEVAASLYLPFGGSLRRVVDLWGAAPSTARPATRVAIAPVRAVTRLRFRRPNEAWPVVHSLFAALDLARDRARGHQILDEWTTDEMSHVW